MTPKRSAIVAIRTVVVAATLASLSGCHRKIGPEDCTKMLDKYVDMTLGDDPSFAAMTESQKAAAREMKREIKKAEPSYRQVHDQCEREVTRAEFDCAVAAKNPNEWEACIE